MQLNSFETNDRTVTAAYSCPCGCAPSLTYQRGDAIASSSCCCGNEFALGPGAERSLQPRDGFELETEPRVSGWDEPVTAAWLVGPSAHPEPAGDGEGHGHHHHDDHDGGAAVDPVCGMSVEPGAAAAKGLHQQHAGVDYYFCGKGCYLEFGDDPDRYLDPGYTPSM